MRYIVGDVSVECGLVFVCLLVFFYCLCGLGVFWFWLLVVVIDGLRGALVCGVRGVCVFLGLFVVVVGFLFLYL